MKQVVVREVPPAKSKIVKPAPQATEKGAVIAMAGANLGGYQICAATPPQFVEKYRIGEPDSWPERGRVVLSWTSGMERHERYLQELSLMASVLKGRPPVSPAELAETIELHTGVQQRYFRVEVTRPEDFLISFRNQREKEAVLRCSKALFCNEVPVSFKPWNRCCWAEASAFQFFTKISLDGLPPHAWEEEAMHKLVNSLDGQLAELIPAADARCLGLFAWFKNPSDLPHHLDVEIPERPAAGRWREGTSATPPSPPREKPALTYPVIIHVEEVIDPTPLHTPPTSFDDNSDDEDVTRRNTFSCWAGRYDGAGPWPTEVGGGHVYGGATGSAGGLGARSFAPIPGEVSAPPRRLLQRLATMPAAGQSVTEESQDDAVLTAAVVGVVDMAAADRVLDRADIVVQDMEAGEVLASQPHSPTLVLQAPGVWFSPQAVQAVEQPGADVGIATPLAAPVVATAKALIVLDDDCSWALVAGGVSPLSPPLQLSLDELTGGELSALGTEKDGDRAELSDEVREATVDHVHVHGDDLASGQEVALTPDGGYALTRAASASPRIRASQSSFGALAKKLSFEDTMAEVSLVEHGCERPALKATGDALSSAQESRSDRGFESAAKAGEFRVYVRKQAQKKPSHEQPGPEGIGLMGLAGQDLGQADLRRAVAGLGQEMSVGQVVCGEDEPPQAHQEEVAHSDDERPVQETEIESSREALSGEMMLPPPASPSTALARARPTSEGSPANTPLPPEADQILQGFLASVATEPPPSLLGRRPPESVPKSKPCWRNVIPEWFTPWRSPRLQQQGNGARRHSTSKAQKVTMKKMGIIEEEEEADQDTFQQYTTVFDQPLSTQHMKALAELLDVDVALEEADVPPPDLASLVAAGVESPA